MTDKNKTHILNSSFRDRSGFLFSKENILYRQINHSYKEHYDFLMDSGIYSLLSEKNVLISHEEVNINNKYNDNAYKIIKPEYIPFISYPYEWCFSQLKDAALLTLEIQEIAIKKGMILKDASAYNIQFRHGKPIFIDTLSFEKYNYGEPWVAYHQFCKHFFAPLLLMKYKDVRLLQLLKTHIDGIPLNLTSKILPLKTYFVFSILTHIHLHAKSQKHFENKKINQQNKKIKLSSLIGIIDNLKSFIQNFKPEKLKSAWSDYAAISNYSDVAINHKKQIIDTFLSKSGFHTVWDIGANNGIFSRIASNKGFQTYSFDSDPYVVEENYLNCRKNNDTNILPLLIDITNPSPGIGWVNLERISLCERTKPDIIMSLALIHHLVISDNLPFEKIAEYFSGLCKILIIEFIPKTDSQIQKLLNTRKDCFDFYSQVNFEMAFSAFFSFIQKIKINDSKRTIYLMQTLER